MSNYACIIPKFTTVIAKYGIEQEGFTYEQLAFLPIAKEDVKPLVQSLSFWFHRRVIKRSDKNNSILRFKCVSPDCDFVLAFRGSEPPFLQSALNKKLSPKASSTKGWYFHLDVGLSNQVHHPLCGAINHVPEKFYTILLHCQEILDYYGQHLYSDNNHAGFYPGACQILKVMHVGHEAIQKSNFSKHIHQPLKAAYLHDQSVLYSLLPYY